MTSPSQAIIPNKYANPGSSGCHTYILPAFFDLCPELGAHTRVLDVGCGNGAVTAQVAQRGSEVLGIDMSETGIQLARRNCPNARFEVLPADAYLLRNLDEEPFDLVYSLEVIEHLYQVPSFIEGCFAATRRGGHVHLLHALSRVCKELDDRTYGRMGQTSQFGSGWRAHSVLQPKVAIPAAGEDWLPRSEVPRRGTSAIPLEEHGDLSGAALSGPNPLLPRRADPEP
jgi:ubiquinone/menaquinone biosynthesis C-methylase UbiE